MAIKTWLLRKKFDVRSAIARESWLFIPHNLIVWWTQYKVRNHIDTSECRVDGKTEFVLDGFQGSGNSFATVTFKNTQDHKVRLAHHLHSPAQIIKAVQAGLPVLVTIREPGGGVVSLTSRWTYVTLEQGLKGYIQFYGKLIPFRDQFVVSTFEDTIHSFDDVIRRVNDRFETDFQILDYSSGLTKPRATSETASWETERNKIKDQKQEELKDPRYADLLAEARGIYSQLTGETV
ncbi:MAG: hypothetical protein HKN43_12570 [Rhodothermales bacterium]|nr:hypothetical protein [Rhodothermales bacterium]